MTTTGSHGTAGSTPMTRASRWVLAAAIAGSALAVGTVHTVTLCVVTAVLAVAAVLAWWGAEPMKARSAATLLLFTGIGLTAYTALQCVPMPIGWLAVIAPHNADVWSRALAPLHEPGPSWAPISLDPTATRVEVLKGVAYLLAFVTALRVARNRDGVRFLSAVVVVTALALALAAVLHPAFGAKRLFGLYEPVASISGRHLAPLMNPNNLAGYLNMALCLSLAAMLAPEPRVPRSVAAAVTLLFVGTQVWVASRGGTITMLVGSIIVFSGSWIARKRRQGSAGTLALVSGAGMLAGAALIGLGGSDEASNELFDANLSKLKAVTAGARILPSEPFFGCGRGAFESVFPAFRTDPGYVTYTHPENVVVQWIVEWGFPVGMAGLILVVFALRPSVVLARSATASGAWAGLMALAVQNFGDLGTEIPGLMLAGVVCAAIVVAGTPGQEPKWAIERWACRSRAVSAGAGVVALAALLLAESGMGHELHDDQLALHDAVAKGNVSVLEMHSLARAMMLRHPAEPYLPFMTALRAFQQKDDTPIPWLGATLERANVYAPAHLILARVVEARSPAQARLEYRLAMDQGPELVRTVMAEAPRVVRGYDDALELIPEGKLAPAVLELLVSSTEARLPATRARLDAEFGSRAPHDPEPLLRLAADAVDDLDAGDAAPWCTGSARAACLQVALEETARVRAMIRDRCAPHALRARARIAAGDAVAGLAEFAEAADRVSDRVACLEQLEAIALQVGDQGRVQEALDKVAKAGCAQDAECAKNLAWVAGQELSRGNQRTALGLYKRAYERSGDSDRLLEVIAELAAKAGLHAEAADDYDHLAARNPGQSQWKKAAQVERGQAMNGALKLP